MSAAQSLIMACGAMALLTFVVAVRMYRLRVSEMRRRSIHPQAVALSAQRAAQLEDTRAADNYNNLFELPVLFYVLCLAGVASDHIPLWLPWLAWLFVLLRVIHSWIQCTYNKVIHRFIAFRTGLFVLMISWFAFLTSYLLT